MRPNNTLPSPAPLSPLPLGSVLELCLSPGSSPFNEQPNTMSLFKGKCIKKNRVNCSYNKRNLPAWLSHFPWQLGTLDHQLPVSELRGGDHIHAVELHREDYKPAVICSPRRMHVRHDKCVPVICHHQLVKNGRCFKGMALNR